MSVHSRPSMKYQDGMELRDKTKKMEKDSSSFYVSSHVSHVQKDVD